MTRCRARQQSANSLNRLAVAPNDPSDIGLAKLDAKNRRFSAGQLVQHHLVRKLDELADNELKELFHPAKDIQPARVVD